MFGSKPSLLVACALCALLLCGCASLQDVTAAQIGCRPDEITIVEDHESWTSRNWVAECRGRRHQCAAINTGNNTSQINCAPEAEAQPAVVTTPTTATVATTPASTAPTVERVTGRSGTSEFAVLRSQFDISGQRLDLAIAPIAHPSTAILTISAPLASLAEGCQAGIMIDGMVTRLSGVEGVVRGRREYRFTLDVAVVRQLAIAERASGRICGTEWRLGAREQGAIRELLVRCDEELAWAGQQTTGGESTQP